MRARQKAYLINQILAIISYGLTMSASRPKTSYEYFSALDGARGALAILIAIYHTIWTTHINATPLMNNGPVLVDLFFVFSGFLMFRLYQGRLKTTSDGRDFIKRRFARIYPLHFFMLMVFVVFQVMRVLSHKVGISVMEPGEILPFQPGAPESLGSFFANLTLTQSLGLFDSLTFNPPAWTVSVEFYAYFVFLAMMLWAQPRKTGHFVIIAGGVAALYFALSRVKPDMNFTYDLGFWRCLAGFYTGVVTAWIYGLMHTKISEAKRGARFTALECMTVAVLFGFVIYCPGRLQFFLAPVAMLFVLVFAAGKGHISTWLSSRLALYLGKISYSIYLVHVIVSIVFSVFAERLLPGLIGEQWNATGLGGDLLLIPYLAVVIGVSHWTYHKIEKPGQKAILEYQGFAKLRARLRPKTSF